MHRQRIRHCRPLALQGSRKTSKAEGAFDNKIAWLCASCWPWRDEVADSASWAERTKKASLDDTIYVITPQGKVLDLPAGSTPLDFAYALHTTSAPLPRPKVCGQMVPLDRPLASGQRVEITAAKSGGPVARLAESGARLHQEPPRAPQRCVSGSTAVARSDLAQGREMVEKEQRREGASRPTSSSSRRNSVSPAR